MQTLLILIVIAVFIFYIFRLPKKVSEIYKDINIVQAKKMMSESKDMIIIDVRTPAEIAQGKIPNSKEINFSDAQSSSQIAQLDTERPYLIYCRSGNRSARACVKMHEMGFKDLSNLAGGYMAWLKT